MPRKFLGQRISPNVDCVRPASLTLTDFDLDQIPDIPVLGCEDESETEYSLDGKGTTQRRISRAFGGTLRLKKRLSSVPEVLLHELERVKENSDVKLERKPTQVWRKHFRRPIPEDSQNLCDKPKSPREVTRRRPKSALPGNQGYIPSPLASPPLQNRHASLMAFPVTAVQNEVDFNSHFHQHNKSEGELLFEEILKAYSNALEDEEPSLVNTQLNNSISRCLKQSNYAHALKQNKKPQVGYSNTVIAGEDEECLVDTSALLEVPAVLEEALSGPEYSNSTSSEPFSSGEEFSELGSIAESLCASPRRHDICRSRSALDDDTYYSAQESPQSIKSANSICRAESEKQTACSLRHVRTRHITPVILEMSDLVSESGQELSEEEICELEEELNDLAIMDASSSVYDD